MKFFSVIFLLILLLSSQPSAFSQTQHWNTVHYENWDFSLPVNDIPFSQITHLILFAGGTGGTQTNTPSPYWHPPANFTGTYAQNVVTAAHAAGTKIIVDLGLGGGWDNVANLVESERQIWASTVAHYIVDNNFDGGDFDLEGSSPIAANMQRMYHLLYDSLRAINPAKTCYLTASVLSNTGSLIGYGIIGGADPGYQYLNQINPMFYDVSGTFASPLYQDQSCPTWGSDSAVAMSFVSAGIPASKVGLGYAIQVYRTNTTTACPPGSFSAYALLREQVQYFPPAAGATVYWNDVNKQSYMINTVSNVKIAYEDTASTWYKADFIKRKGLGGAMGFCLARGYLPNPPAGVSKNMAAYGMGRALFDGISPPPPPSSYAKISGRVFFDSDDNGIEGIGEPGITYWKISLKRTSPDTMSYSTLTDLNGSYAFDSLPSGVYRISENSYPSNGDSLLTWIQTYPHPTSFYIVTLSGDTTASGYNFGNYSPGIVYASVNKGWNLISNPVAGTNDSVRQLFHPSVYTYMHRFIPDSGYVQESRMINGFGYWGKFSNSQNITITGAAIETDTIDVSAGWNLIGSISLPVFSPSIVAIGTSIQSPFYEYNNGYQASDFIKSGKGYWVRVNTDGQLILSSTSTASAKTQSFNDVLSSLNSFVIEDSHGNQHTLYFGAPDLNELINYRFELPPMPPAGIFDARFASHRLAESVDGEKQKDIPVLISSAVYPVRIYWKDNSSSVISKLIIDGKIIPMNSEGETQIASPQFQIALRMIHGSSSNELPQEFTLEQNYPNPFNPLTVIRYSLPVNSHVTIKVYDVLGREVSTLLKETQDAGYKSIEWNATNNASGMYFYKIEATSVNDPGVNFVQIRKLALVK